MGGSGRLPDSHLNGSPRYEVLHGTDSASDYERPDVRSFPSQENTVQVEAASEYPVPFKYALKTLQITAAFSGSTDSHVDTRQYAATRVFRTEKTAPICVSACFYLSFENFIFRH